MPFTWHSSFKFCIAALLLLFSYKNGSRYPRCYLNECVLMMTATTITIKGFWASLDF